jgi:hypothetical protein
LMLENKHPYGNMAVLVNAIQPGMGASSAPQAEVVSA